MRPQQILKPHRLTARGTKTQNQSCPLSYSTVYSKRTHMFVSVWNALSLRCVRWIVHPLHDPGQTCVISRSLCLAVEAANGSRGDTTESISTPDLKDKEGSTSCSHSEVRAPVSFAIRAEGKVHKVAGAIASELREGGIVVARATGTMAVNLGVKALCIGRQFINGDPGTDLEFRINHQQGADKDRISQLLFAVSSCEHLYEPAAPVEDLRISIHTKGRSAGLQIASIVQNNRIPNLRALGPRSVGNMIVGTAWARRFLRKKNMDVLCYPKFRTVLIEDKGDRTSVEVLCKPVPYIYLPHIDFDSDEDAGTPKIEPVDGSSPETPSSQEKMVSHAD